MTSGLHTDIEKIAGKSGALALSAELLSSLLLDRMKGAATSLAGAVFPTKHSLVSAEFKGLTIDPKKLKLSLDLVNSQVVAKVGPDFKFTVRLCVTADKSKTFSKAVFEVSDLAVAITGELGNLVFSLQPGRVEASFETDNAERDDAILASGITTDELLRVEGVFAYGTGDSVLQSAFGSLKNINLATMFPHLILGGTSTLKLTTNKDYLLVQPESLSLAAFTGCPPKDPTAGLVVAARPVAGDPLGLDIVTKVAPSAYKAPSKSNPLAALFAPKQLLDERFSGLAPGLTHYDRGTGVIGHELRITVTLTHVAVSIGADGLTLSVGLKLWGRATINVELPCLGRKDIASLEIALPEDNGEADISVSLSLALDQRARVLVQCEVVGISLGKPSVKLDLFGSIVPNFYGYVTDFIIGRILRNNIPWLVHDKIKEALDHKFTVVADLGEYLPFLQSEPNVSTFSGAAESALMGLTLDR